MNSVHKTRSLKHHLGGFGLLEALVALVLLSSVGLTLLAWVQQSLDTTQRIRDFYIEQDARRAALDWIRSTNPMAEPTGEFLHNQIRIRWKNTPESKPIAQIGYPQGIGKHEIALFKTEIVFFRPGDTETPWFTEEIITIGHHRTGTRAAPFN